MKMFWRDRLNGRRWGDAFVDRRHNSPEELTIRLTGPGDITPFMVQPILGDLGHDPETCPDCQDVVEFTRAGQRVH